MNLQDILTFAIVTTAFGYAIYSFIKLFISDKSTRTGKCSGCTACPEQKDLS